jgi:hypothetical protein
MQPIKVTHTTIHWMARISIQSLRLIPTESFIDCFGLSSSICPFCNKITKEVDVSCSKSPCQRTNKFSIEGVGRVGVLVTSGGNMGSLGNLGPDPG